MVANAVDTMPRSELIKKLRTRGLPIRLFAETDEKSLKRLRIELEKPEFNVGLKNDFQAALLLQVENEEVMEKIAKGSTDTNEVDTLNIVIEESEEDATWEQIQMGQRFNSSPEMIKRSPAVQAGMQKQTVEHMNPLLRSLEKHSVNFDIRAHLTNITRFCILDRDYVQSNNVYMEMAIGNSSWPVGVTRSGIHQRPGSSKAYASNIAHVMNDETQRKYIHGLK